MSPIDSIDISPNQPIPISAHIFRESSSHLLLLRQKLHQQRSAQPSNPPGALDNAVSPPPTPLSTHPATHLQAVTLSIYIIKEI